MGITFTRAPIVQPGDPMRSRDLRGLARAFNDRIRSGLADAAWRIGYWWLSPFRLVRNPDASGYLFPPIAEFLETYAHIRAGRGEWPVAGPGDPEGANVASQMMGFVFGLEAANVESEDVRLTDPEGGGMPLWLGSRPPETPAEFWLLAKLQRGAYDPATGALSNGAMWIAQSHAYLQPGSRSMHGYQFGGYLPSPSVGGTCATPGDGSPTPINWQWVFTNLEDATVLTYGSCPEDPTALAGGAPYYTLDNIVLFFNDGSIQVLPKKQWIDGPYTQNPRLRKLFNGAPERAMNAFVRDFRGPNQRPETWLDGDGWNGNAFDFQSFFSTQYLLAPARGQSVGDVVVDVYPRFRTTGLAPLPGPLRNQNGSADLHTITPGFVAAGALVTSRQLAGPATVEVLHNGTTVLAAAELQPDTTGRAEVIVWWDAVNTGTISFRLTTPATFAAEGYIQAELAELLDYKPQIRDAYVLLRIGGIDVDNITDGTGVDFDRAAEIGDSYFERGCALSLLGHAALEGSMAEVNRNAVFDAMRRLSRSVRFVRGDDVVGYAVENGKSVLWIKRYAAGLSHDVDADMFAGIVDAIAPTAPSGGFTNEWVMTADFRAFRNEEASIWKPDAYTRFWPLMNRCQLLDPDIAQDPVSRWHYAYGQHFVSPPAVPISESPSGYTYAQYGSFATSHINTKLCDELDTACIDARADFYRSCRIYEPPPEIEKCEALNEGGLDLVKVTFKTRFHHHATAPSSIGRDVGTWVIADVQGEGYRTWENAIREFLIYQATGTLPSLKLGDRSQNYVAGGLGDEPLASIWPELVFVQLAREPYTDDNDIVDGADTPLWSDEWAKLEIYLHAMCPGYIDGKTSMAYACEHGTTGAFDYSFESLCYHAFGGRWVTTLATAPTDYIAAEDVRPDSPQGFGPLPNTLAAAETFNQFAAAVNLLTAVRVMLPTKFETRTAERQLYTVVDVRNAAGDSVADTGIPSTSLGSDYAVWIDTVPPTGGTWSWTSWSEPGDFFAAINQATLLETGASQWSIWSIEQRVQWRWSLLDPDAINAIPPEWQGMLTDNAAVLAVEEVRSEPQRRVYAAHDAGRQCHDGLIVADTVWNGAPGGQAWDFVIDSNPLITCGEFAIAGELVPPPFPYSTHWASDMVSTNPDNYCNGGPTTSRTLTPINKDTILVVVPLVDAPAP